MTHTPPLLARIVDAKSIHVVGVAGTEAAAIACWLIKMGRSFVGHEFGEKKDFRANIRRTHAGQNAAKKKHVEDNLWQSRKDIFFGKEYLKDIEKADIICVSQHWQAYPVNAKLKRIFAKHPERFVTITQLYFQLFPGRILAVTGTNGKSTTTRLIADIMEKSRQKIWFTGNDRRNEQVLDKLDKMNTKDWLVIEVSNRQLARQLGRAPDIAVITNVSANHLDEYGGSMARYKSCKYSLIKNQSAQHIAVLNADNPATRSFIQRACGHVVPYSTETTLTHGVHIDNGMIVYTNGARTNVVKVDSLKVIGRHNLSNVCAAIAATRQAGVDWQSIRVGIKSFAGMPQRMQVISRKRGVTWIDDSVSTSPDSSIAAIASFPEATVRLIAGGDPKGMSYNRFAAVCKKARLIEAVLLDSPAGKLMASEIKKRGVSVRIVGSLEAAVQYCAHESKRGEQVLFSPTAAWYIYHLQHKIPGGGQGYADFIKRYN